MLKKIQFVLVALAISGAAQAVPLTVCGQARPDLKVCISSWALPSGPSGSSLLLQYASGEAYSMQDPQFTRNADGEGINWYVGTGTVRGQWMQVWLREDVRPLMLPVVPPAPPTAQVYYRTVPNAPWQIFPGTGSFLFNIYQ